jgi:hypothetical protein
MSSIKGLAEIGAMLAVLVLVSMLSPPLAMFLCLSVFIVGLFAVFRPLPKLRLTSRPYNLAVAVIVGLLGTGIPATMSLNADKRLAELKASDPSAYLAELEKSDGAKWLDEMKVLDPTRYAAEFAKAEAKKAEMARVEAEEKAKLEAERVEAERIAAQEKAEAEKAEAMKSLDADKATLRSQVTAQDWAGAKASFERVKKSGADLGQFIKEVEASALAIVKELPGTDLKANQTGYDFLAAVVPASESYRTKADDYASRIVQARENAVEKLRRTEDKIEGVAFFSHPGQPKFVNSRSTVFLYIGQSIEGGKPWLRMKVQYAASDWLFVNRVQAWYDGSKEDLTSGSFERDNNASIWEWQDMTPQPYQVELLEKLANAKEAILRFEGQQYRKDVTLSAGDKQALREVLLAYRVLAGEE